MERIPSFARCIVCLLFLAGGLTLGCARKSADNAAGPPTVQPSDEHVGQDVAVQPVDPSMGSPAVAPSTDAPPIATSDASEPPPPLYRGSIAGQSAVNPLRDESPPLSLAPAPAPVNNPLRAAHAFRARPKAYAAPPEGGSPPPEYVPRMAFPVGESAAPAGADPPAAVAPESIYSESSALNAADSAAPLDVLPVNPREAAPPPGGGGAVQPLVGEPVTPVPGAHDVVEVFYGTDRAAIEPPAVTLPEQATRFLPTAISVLITMALGLVALARRRPAAWLLVGGGVIVSLGLAYQASSGTLAAVRRSGHVGPQYTSERAPAGQVQLGLCEVTIPKSHQLGELEAPSILRLEVRPDAERHVVLRKTERLADERFYELLAQRVAASPRKELLVFVHGFNVRFEDAARRTAQLHHDLGFEGAPVFFSWPANDKFVLTYKADEANVSWSTAHLKQFLLDVTKRSQAQSINLIAHSMGNRALTAALKELQLELADESRLFNQVILAAPDIDADEFRQSIAPALSRTANRVTLYASARDEALAASQLVHRGPRAGDAGRGLVVIPGIDTIDVTPIDTSLWGHSYYGSSDPVLRDLGLLISQSAAPGQRAWLSPAELEGLPYWIFQPQTTTARAPGGSGF
jgi:esterase/lipase superfamily enzyme